MEGVAGISTGGHINRGSDDYPYYRRLMTEEASVAVAGPPRPGRPTGSSTTAMETWSTWSPTCWIQPRACSMGRPKPGGMMAGLDETFQACMFIGYHARAGETAAVRDHTINGAIVHSVSVNGREWAECDLNAAHAGSLDVPLVLVSGHDKICAHVREHQPWARTKECQPGPFLRRRDGARVAFAALVAKSDHE